MLIQNNFFQNKYKKSNLQIAKQPALVNFTGKTEVLTKEINLNPDEFKNVAFISEMYDKILSILSKLNGVYQKKFKSLYPNLVAGEKIKGFVFESVQGLNDKRLQIVRFNPKSNSDELLTFGVLDGENNNLLRYRISKNGRVLLSSEKENVSKLSLNPFEQNITYGNYLKLLVDEMQNFGFYSENFKFINRNTSNKSSELQFGKTISELKFIQKSNGIQPEITELFQSYKSLSEILNQNLKTSSKLKEGFLGYAGEKSKGLEFKDFGSESKSIYFCPLKSKEDNRVFKIVISDKDGNLENAYVFYEDGRVSVQKQLSEETNAFRPNNLRFISDNEIEKSDLKNVFKFLDEKFSDFKEYINAVQIEKTNKKLEVAAHKQEIKKQKNIEMKEQKAQEILQKKKEKAAQKALLSEQKALLREEEKLRIKQEKQRLKEERKQLLLQQKLEKQQLKKRNYSVKIPKPQVDTTQSDVVQYSVQSQKILKYSNYSQMRLYEIVNDLENLFQTPVEKRSSHLVHEKLANGNIFAGRFSMKASDGSTIKVSRVKSPKYVDFTYYSIDVQNPGGSFKINIDPQAGKILLSKDGKPVINRKSMVSYISKDEFLNQNPTAANLPTYLNEIFDYHQGQGKLVKSSIKHKSQFELLKEKERELETALNSEVGVDFID